MANDPANSRLKLSNFAAKLLTGVQPAPHGLAADRWSSSASGHNLKHSPHPPRPAPPCRSVKASAFAAAKQDRASHRLPVSNPERSCPHEQSPSRPPQSTPIVSHHAQELPYPSSKHHHHQRTQSQFSPGAAAQALGQPHSQSPVRPHKGSAPAAITDSSDRYGGFKLNDSLLQYFLNQTNQVANSKENELPERKKKSKTPGSWFEQKRAKAESPLLAVAYSNTLAPAASPVSMEEQSKMEPDHAPCSPTYTNGHDSSPRRPSAPPPPGRPLLYKQPLSQSSSSSAASGGKNPIRELYLSQASDSNGPVPNEKQRVDREFEKLLDAMQVPGAVKVKMNGLDHPVKSAMLKSSNNQALLSMIGQQSEQAVQRPAIQQTPHLPSSGGKVTHLASQPTANGRHPKSDTSKEGSAWWAMYLKSHNFRELLACDLKRLRVALRTQPPFWTKEFIGFGGYLAMLKRLKELLEIEWREEQHDDQVLFEILRCFKALLLTEPGKEALRSRLPDPFLQLTNLLFSEKKPGDLSSRQVLLELILGCFELNPQTASQGVTCQPHEDYPLLNLGKLDWSRQVDIQLHVAHTGGPPSSNDVGNNGDESSSSITTWHDLVKSLLMGPPDGKKEQILEFVVVTHRPRPFKTLVNEFIGVLMDYFWVFCHADNKFWDLNLVDEEKMEAPKVPSGMTGGVEYEAMSYCAVMMRLINQLVKTSETREQARAIHQQLFESGIERCLVTLRKSSTTYYPTVHLELARYLSLGLEVEFEFPYSISRHYYSGNPL